MVTLSRFTPSLLDEATLERLFVNREHLLADAVARIERTAAGSERANKLFVGPRGSGKTHLLSLVYHRARRLDSYGTGFQLAWLPEDPWTIASLDDFLVEVLDHLEPERADRPRSNRPLDDVVALAQQSGPIVVLVENLDQIMNAIGPEGQRRLRSLLETERSLLLIATATRITEHLIGEAEPFYGFFDTTTLHPFDVDEATSMLQAIAKVQGDLPLVHRLAEPRARGRLAAVEHLAGGQPRVWALLATGLSAGGLDDLVSTLLERFDDLTPYYQEQLARLSPHERRIVRALADGDRAMTVRELAEITRIEQRSLAKTMGELRRRGWVRPRTGLLTAGLDRRLTFYQLAEPLARLAFQLKASRGRPVKLVLDFLTAWFDHDELLSDSGSAADAYVEAARTAVLAQPMILVCHGLTGSSIPALAVDPRTARYAPRPATGSPALAATLESLDDALAAYQHCDAVPLLEQPTGLSQLVEHRLAMTSIPRLRAELSQLALAEGVADQREWARRVEEAMADVTSDEDRVAGFLALARVHLGAGNDNMAAFAHRQAMDVVRRTPTPALAVISASSAKELLRTGHPAVALELLDAIRPAVPIDQRLTLARVVEAISLRIGHISDAVAEWRTANDDVTAALGSEHDYALMVRSGLAGACQLAGRTAEAVTILEEVAMVCERVLGRDHQHTQATRANLACSYYSAGRVTDAAAILEQVVSDGERLLGPEHPGTLTVRGTLAAYYLLGGRTADATAILEQVVSDSERLLGPEHSSTLIAKGNLANSYSLAGRTADATPIFEQVVSDSERLLGPEHPSTLIARINLADSYSVGGRVPDAIALEEQAVVDHERLLGAGHPNTLVARRNLAAYYWLDGRRAAAIAVLEQVVADSDRVLGPEHPESVERQAQLTRMHSGAEVVVPQNDETPASDG